MEYKSLLDITDGGREIFDYYFPELSKFFDNTKTKFVSPFRTEKVPSSHFWEVNGTWYLKDFGDNSYNAIHAVMKHLGCDWNKAVSTICHDLGIVNNERKKSYPKADYSKRGKSSCKDGVYLFPKKVMTEKEQKWLCPLNTPDQFAGIGFASLQGFSIVRNAKEQYYGSNDSYPIYAREVKEIDDDGRVTKTVHKIYQPLHKPKNGTGPSYKFFYKETDCSPDKIINGLYELKKAWENNPTPDEKGHKKIKAVICCGERDACCVYAAGYNPIWFNSEGHKMTKFELKRIKKYCDELYYIPDIDKPGQEYMRYMIKHFPELLIVMLPPDMLKKRSDQGKSCKDLRDYMRLHPSKDAFYDLVNNARSYKITKYVKDKCVLSPDNLLFMLKMDGYAKWRNPIDNSMTLVKIDGNVVKQVTVEDIRQHVIEHVRSDNAYSKYERDTVMGYTHLNNNIKDLELKELDFSNSTVQSQIFHCKNNSFIVSADGINEIDKDHVGMVWDKKQIKCDVELVEPIFTFERVTDISIPSTPPYKVTIANEKCNLMRFISNISNIHYAKESRGVTLTQEEENEKQLCLQAHMFAFGHLLHRFNISDKMWAPYYTEYIKFDSESPNGGTGKSILFKSFFPMLGYICVSVKVNEKNGNEQFQMQLVTHDTDVVYFDECPKNMDLSARYADITDGIQFEKKHQNRIQFSVEDNPRIAFISNYDMAASGGSTNRRIHITPVSHHYHEKDDEAGFDTSHTVGDDFGILWGVDYPQDHFNLDVNCAMQIEAFYLSALKDKVSITAPLKAFEERRQEKEESPIFNVWAKSYFVGDRVDREIVKNDALNDYNVHLKELMLRPVTPNKFTKDLKTWIKSQVHLEYNPIESCTEPDRRRIKRNNVEYILIKTKPTETLPALPDDVINSDEAF